MNLSLWEVYLCYRAAPSARFPESRCRHCVADRLPATSTFFTSQPITQSFTFAVYVVVFFPPPIL